MTEPDDAHSNPSLDPQEEPATEPPTPASYEPDDDPGNWSVHDALRVLQRRVGAIPKAGTAEPSAGGYRFRGIDQLYAAVHRLVPTVGLTILPRVIEAQFGTRARSGGGTMQTAHLHVELTATGPDGSTVTFSAWGEGADTSDKATQKAHSQAIKSAYLSALQVPTEDSAAAEPDASAPSFGDVFTPEQVERAETALQHALAATSVDDLGSVRARAQQLLEVPVADADGRVARLAVHIDRLREALTGGQR